MRDNVVAKIILAIRDLESASGSVTEFSVTWPNYFSEIFCSYQMRGETKWSQFLTQNYRDWVQGFITALSSKRKI